MTETQQAIRGMAHDLNGTVALAVLIADGLERHADPDVTHAARRIGTALDAVSSICREAMRAEVSPTDRTVLNRDALWALFEEVAELTAAKGSTTTRRAALRIDVAAGVEIACDRSALFRILFNLTRNAATALSAGDGSGGIAISAARGARGCFIDVVDDGPGLPAAVVARHFEGVPAVPDPARPDGIGLPTTMRIAREIGARVTLLRTGRDGTALRISFPAVDGPGTAPRARRRAARC